MLAWLTNWWYGTPNKALISLSRTYGETFQLFVDKTMITTLTRDAICHFVSELKKNTSEESSVTGIGPNFAGIRAITGGNIEFFIDSEIIYMTPNDQEHRDELIEVLSLV